jgi:hypothetical protein
MKDGDAAQLREQQPQTAAGTSQRDSAEQRRPRVQRAATNALKA